MRLQPSQHPLLPNSTETIRSFAHCVVFVFGPGLSLWHRNLHLALALRTPIPFMLVLVPTGSIRVLSFSTTKEVVPGTEFSTSSGLKVAGIIHNC